MLEIVTRRRSIFVLFTFLWVAAPVLACVPTAAMTDAEMACCKKMAGNCEMGSGNHSCCKNTINRAKNATAIISNPEHHVTVATITTVSDDEIAAAKQDHQQPLRFSPLGTSPPTLKSVLRI